MSGPPRFDLAIVGSGPGGYRAAVLGALRGLKVAIIEKAVWGGCCLNRGCVPKKDWHYTATLVAASRDFAGRGLHGALQADLAIAWQHQKNMVNTVRASYVDYLGRLGVTTLQGNARFVDAQTLASAGSEHITARHTVIATGAAPWFPPELPLTPGRIISTDELFDSPPPPGRRVAVCGSGVVGTEFAFILAMLGLRVTWITKAQPLAANRFSPSAHKALAAALERHGITPLTGARVAQAEIHASGVRLRLEDGQELEVDWVLAASGRKPQTAGLDLAVAGVATDDDGFIRVNDRQQTSTPNIFAIGDVCTRKMTANQALAQAAVAVANIVSPGTRCHDGDAVPFLVYSALKLGRIGITEDEAEERGVDAAVGFAAFEVNPRALGQDDRAGFVRILADQDSGALLGAEIVGAEAGELINLIGQHYGRTDALAQLAATRFNHPTRAEEILNAVETLAARWGLAKQVFGA